MNSNHTFTKTLGPRSAHLITTLYENGKTIFRLKDAQAVLGLSPVSTRSFVRKLADRGIASRIKGGLYQLVPFELGHESHFSSNPLLIGRELMKDQSYYFSHATAMEIHGMVTQPQLVFNVSSSALHSPTVIQGIKYRFVFCKSSSFFGITDHWVTKQEKVKVSDPERTVIDGLKQPKYCGGITEIVKGILIQRQILNVSKLISYAVRLNVAAVNRRLGYILETLGIGSENDIEILRSKLPLTYSILDPVLPAEGKYLKRWGLRLNVNREELLHVADT
jgi:predicted transcriptional regulator of viral defense system